MGLKAKPNLTRLSVSAVVVAVAKRGSKYGVEFGEEKATQKGLDVQPFFSEEGRKAQRGCWFKTCIQYLYYGPTNSFSL